MRYGWIGMTVLGAAMSLSGTALADHNSKWGEGTANMPNDIHNTRVETQGDNEAFREFVQKGNGADSVNRFATEDEETERGVAAREKGENGQALQAGERVRENTRARKEEHKALKGAEDGSETRNMDRIRTERRIETRTRSTLRDNPRAVRGAGGRGR